MHAAMSSHAVAVHKHKDSNGHVSLCTQHMLNKDAPHSASDAARTHSHLHRYAVHHAHVP